ncbi:hypothetical protein RSOLAG22IIIB_04835 [Rhizoctonia solani]|uniref:Uncharacterized protein n=1 Tax=Rhizoctonia solani TaxID=456999 RepID=A0A0K6G044_9AGAM|nr:hypothetical protein RSOLAG22IIIB_04835 [Rhizoctonia solani]
MATPSPSSQDTENLLKDFLAFPFHEDRAFLEGLQLLLGQPVVETFQRGGPITPELEQALLGPKIFYYNRQHGTELTPEVVEEYTRMHPQVNPQAGPKSPGTPPFTSLAKTPDEDRQLSLAELTRLIETGQTHLIPHNYTIPDGVQTQAPEPSKVPIKKKPWERTDQEEEQSF